MCPYACVIVISPCLACIIKMDERDKWNAFKKKARIKNPIGSKIDHRYYERLRKTFRAQKDKVETLDRWLSNGLDLQIPKRTTEEDQ